MGLPRARRRAIEGLLTVAVLALLFSAMYRPYWFAALGIVLAGLLYLPLSRPGRPVGTSAGPAAPSKDQCPAAERKARLGGILLVLALVVLDLSMQVVGSWVVTYGDERPGPQEGTIEHKSLRLWGHEIGFVEAELWPGGHVRTGGCLLVAASGQLRRLGEGDGPIPGTTAMLLGGRAALQDGRTLEVPSIVFDWKLEFGRPMVAAGWSGSEDLWVAEDGALLRKESRGAAVY
jgi:hypothetical protein